MNSERKPTAEHKDGWTLGRKNKNKWIMSFYFTTKSYCKSYAMGQSNTLKTHAYKVSMTFLI